MSGIPKQDRDLDRIDIVNAIVGDKVIRPPTPEKLPVFVCSVAILNWNPSVLTPGFAIETDHKVGTPPMRVMLPVDVWGSDPEEVKKLLCDAVDSQFKLHRGGS
jgi:hypothetical protein